MTIAKTNDLRARGKKGQVMKTVFAILCVVSVLMVSFSLVFAANNGEQIWSTVTTTIKNLLGKLNTLSTVICGLVVVIAMIWRMVSSNPRSVETATSWAKRAAISFVIINTLSYIIGWFSSTFKGAYTG